ncbi:MAG: DUF6376 family protein [Thermoleophilaceae bacterium]
MTRVLTLCLAALALIAAGCGGDDGASEEDYEREVREVGQTLESTFGELGTSISGSGSTEQAAEKLEEGAASLDEAAADFRGIDPPSDIEDSHNEIVSGLEALADEFRTGAEAAEGGDLSKLLEFAQGLQSSDAVQQITEAGNQIEEEGYDFNSGGGGGDGGGE